MVESSTPGPGERPPAAATPVVFLVDDEPMVLELTELVLRPLGCSIEKFRDPSLALERFKSSNPRPSLLVTDYAMQGMDGLALMDACRSLEPAQKVLLMSGTVTSEVFSSRSAKPDAFIDKPFNVGEFARIVGKLVS